MKTFFLFIRFSNSVVNLLLRHFYIHIKIIYLDLSACRLPNYIPYRMTAIVVLTMRKLYMNVDKNKEFQFGTI